jgi:iron complex transport system ATP-binding protein
MSEQSKIVLSNVSLGYKKNGVDVSVLKELNLSFYAGDFVGIVGLNGVGKSTLLKSICGLLPLLKGEISIDGKKIEDVSIHELAKKIAIVLTEKIGGFNLKAYDVVSAGQMPYTDSFNRLKSENIKIIDAAIETCGLFQKTMIAKALVQQTPIMLLDEPSAFLDYASKHDLFILLKRLSEQENKCVLVSSHDLDLIIKYCSKLLVVSPNSVELISTSQAKENTAFLEIGGAFL